MQGCRALLGESRGIARHQTAGRPRPGQQRLPGSIVWGPVPACPTPSHSSAPCPCRAVVSSLVSAGRLDAACEVLDWMREDGVEGNAVVHQVLINAFLERGQQDKVGVRLGARGGGSAWKGRPAADMCHQAHPEAPPPHLCLPAAPPCRSTGCWAAWWWMACGSATRPCRASPPSRWLRASPRLVIGCSRWGAVAWWAGGWVGGQSQLQTAPGHGVCRTAAATRALCRFDC